MRGLLARAERLRDRVDEEPDGRDLLAAGALAAAEARVWTIGGRAANPWTGLAAIMAGIETAVRLGALKREA